MCEGARDVPVGSLSKAANLALNVLNEVGCNLPRVCHDHLVTHPTNNLVGVETIAAGSTGVVPTPQD